MALYLFGYLNSIAISMCFFFVSFNAKNWENKSVFIALGKVKFKTSEISYILMLKSSIENTTQMAM